jgi:hypothetical protein
MGKPPIRPGTATRCGRSLRHSRGPRTGGATVREPPPVHVAQNFILLYRGFSIRTGRLVSSAPHHPRPAECNSAIRQIANLRHDCGLSPADTTAAPVGGRRLCRRPVAAGEIELRVGKPPIQPGTATRCGWSLRHSRRPWSGTATACGMSTGQAGRSSVLTSGPSLGGCGASPRHSAIVRASLKERRRTYTPHRTRSVPESGLPAAAPRRRERYHPSREATDGLPDARSSAFSQSGQRPRGFHKPALSRAALETATMSVPVDRFRPASIKVMQRTFNPWNRERYPGGPPVASLGFQQGTNTFRGMAL